MAADRIWCALRSLTDFIVWHCSATRPHQDIGAKEIDIMHKKRGWSGIGYHFVIRRNGVLEAGRALEDSGAHVRGYNHRSVGICMVGGISPEGVPTSNFTSEQWNTASVVQHFLETLYSKAETLGHRDLSSDRNQDGKITEDEWMKECPCFDVRKIFK